MTASFSPDLISSPRRLVADLGNRVHVSTSTNRHIVAIHLDAAVYRFAGAFYTGAEIERARYERSFADADVAFAGAAR